MGFFDELLGTDPKTKARKQAKRDILDRLEIDEIKGACKAYGIGEPSQWTEDFLTGQKTRRKVTREHWVALAYDDLKLDQLLAYCQKKRIAVNDVVEKLDGRELPPPAVPQQPKAVPIPVNTSPPSQPRAASTPVPPRPTPVPSPVGNPLETLIQDLTRFEPEDIRDEEDLEKQLTQYLKLKYAGKVERQVPTARGKIDIVLDRRFAIELKLAEDIQRIRGLVGQALDYKKLYPHTLVVIVDVGNIPKAVLEEYVADFKGHGIMPIVLEASLKRRKARSTYIQMGRR